MRIDIIIAFLFFSGTSCAQDAAKILVQVDSLINEHLEAWIIDTSINQTRLSFKIKNYEGLNFPKHVQQILSFRKTAEDEIIIWWFYNPLEYASYTYVLHSSSPEQYNLHQYFPTVPHFSKIGKLHSSLVINVVELLCQRKNQELTDEIFISLRVSKGKLALRFPEGFTMGTDLQILYSCLMATVNP